MSRFVKTIQLFDNLSNPILVKELRQSVKGKFLIVVLGLILTIQLFMWWIFTLPDTISSISGESAYFGLLSLFGFSLAVCMPVYTGWRILVERANQDLLYVSALSPFQIIWGKFLASAGIIFIVFSTFLPFFYLTLLLGGIDSLTITYTLLITLVGLFSMITFSIFVLCGVVPTILKACFVLGFLAGNIFIGTIVFLSMEVFFNNYGFVDEQTAFTIFLSWMIGGVLVNGLFIVLSAAIISPSSSNRAVIPRIYTTFMALVSYITFAIVITTTNAFGGFYPPGFINIVLYIASVATLPFAILMFLISCSGRFKYGLRLNKSIPDGFFKKVLWFPFYSGAVNGVVYSLFFIGGCFAVLGYISIQTAATGFGGSLPKFLRDANYDGSLFHLTAYFNYTAIYAWIGMLIYQKTERLTPLVWTILLFGCIGLITITSYLSFFQTSVSGEEKIAFVLLPNAPAFFDGEEIIVLFGISSLINVLLLIAVSGWILIPQLRDYFSAYNDNPSPPEKIEKSKHPALVEGESERQFTTGNSPQTDSTTGKNAPPKMESSYQNPDGNL